MESLNSPRVFTVEGMTCGHCVDAVTREVSALAGASDVAVHLATKTLTLNGDVTEAEIAAAVEEAGYTLVTQ